MFGFGGAIFKETFDELNYFDAASWSASGGVRVSWSASGGVRVNYTLVAELG